MQQHTRSRMVRAYKQGMHCCTHDMTRKPLSEFRLRALCMPTAGNNVESASNVYRSRVVGSTNKETIFEFCRVHAVHALFPVYEHLVTANVC